MGAGAVAAPDFVRDDLKQWLLEQPRDVAIAIAVRCALRILPVVETAFAGEHNVNASASKLILPMFRAVAVSSASVVGHSDEMVVAATRVAASAILDSSADSPTASVFASISASTYTVFADAFAAAAADSAAYANAAAEIEANAITAAVHADQDSILEGASAKELMGLKLWPGAIPDGIITHWLDLSARLTELDLDWDIWIAWYQLWLEGHEAPAPLSLACALLPNTVWDTGPEAVNPVLRRLDEHWKTVGSEGFQGLFENVYAEHAPEEPVPNLFARDADFSVSKPSPNEPSTPPPARHDVKASADRAETTRDLLGRASTAFQLATHLNRIWSQQVAPGEGGDEAAFIVHIDAPWGGGKTTFANFVARMLNRDAYGLSCDHELFTGLPFDSAEWRNEFKARKWIPITYNAWRHQHVSPPWWNFYKVIRRNGVRKVAAPRSWGINLLDYLWRVVTPELLKSVIVVLAMVTILVFVWDQDWFKSLMKTKKLADGDAEIPIGGILLTLVAGGGGLVMINWVRSGLRKVVDSVDNSADAASLGEADPLVRFRSHFRRLMKWFDEPVLVIVDDLDRCEPAFVVELVRGMMTIFNSPRVIFVLLGDKRWIEQSFEVVHAKMKPAHEDDTVKFGARFAEKAIQLSFVLPEADESQRNAYVRELLIGSEQTSVSEGAVAEEDLEGLRSFAEEAEEKLAPAESFTAQTEQLKELHVVIDERFAQSPPELRDAAERVLYGKAALRAGMSQETEMETRHALLTIVDELPVNPRRIKRILNMVAIYQLTALELQRVVLGDYRWKQLVLWIIFMSERADAWREYCKEGEVEEPDELVQKLLGEVEFDGERVTLDADAREAFRRLTPVV